MKSYSDILFETIRARGWKTRIFAYVGRDHRRMFCADAQREGLEPQISHAESMLAALLALDRRCQEAELALSSAAFPATAVNARVRTQASAA